MRRVFLLLLAAATACTDTTAPLARGPGCTLSQPIAAPANLSARLEAHYPDCPAPRYVAAWSWGDGSKVVDFTVRWDTH